MKIAATQFNLETNTLEIYLSGCNIHCDGCHNPELQSFDVGDDYQIVLPKILTKLIEFKSVISNVWILGGEPLDQHIEDLQTLIKRIKLLRDIDIWLFTGHTLDFVNEKHKWIYDCVDYLKYGKFDNTKQTDNNIQYGIKLSSENQNIIKVKHEIL